jgi:hypothetical protein
MFLRNPSLPSSIIVRISPTSEAITGKPTDMASKIVSGIYSVRDVRGYPETFHHGCASVKQLPGGHEIQGSRMA